MPTKSASTAHLIRYLGAWALAIVASISSDQRNGEVFAQETSPTVQISPHKLAREVGQGRGGDLAALITLEANEADYTGPKHDAWLDALITRLIFVGDHAKAHELNSKAYAGSQPKSTPTDGSELKGYNPTPAIGAILQLAEGRRVIMLNEEHRSTRERAFANELLRPLRQAGFTHLALETIEGGTQEIERRKYPVMSDGTYTHDPVLGDLVRQAVELGMGIVAYEADMKQMPEDVQGPIGPTNWRERRQAENLHQFLISEPEARLVVWSGRHHMSEDPYEPGAATDEEWTPMGGIFKKISGIDPLTVDLMIMNEQHLPEREHPTFQWATQKGLIDTPTVFQNDVGKTWSPMDSIDAAVFFPRTDWIQNRPSWLSMNGLRGRVSCDWLNDSEIAPSPAKPLLLEAFVKGEATDAVPMDRVIWRQGQAPPVYLRQGKAYTVQVRDSDGNVLLERPIDQ